jgi:2-polyprenyl-6-methoxyphenol hydroxylase-like FAD-dependent oxidoreductase
VSLSTTVQKQDHVQKHSDRQHALVIGASIAGLLAARVLSDYFEYVTIIERDTLPAYAQTRKGVPQGEHIHLLMGKGAQIMDSLFPWLFSALEQDGALLLSPTDDFHWFHFGAWKLQFPGPLRLHSQSRPLLEYHIRRCVAGIPNVHLLDNCTALGLVAGQSSPVNGVRVHYGQREESIEANLVVDASGRGSQAPAWLTTLGYPAIEETLVRVDIGYATRIYRRKAHIPLKALGIYPWPLDKKRIGYLFPIEQDAWVVTLSGYLRDYPPIDEAGFLAFASTLARPDIFETIKDAQPLSAIAVHKFPANRWRHYERLSRMPDGLIVLGDAVCSFNPVYGQGMTVAALEAQALRDCLERQVRSHSGDLSGFSTPFQKALASIIRVPWMFATSEDFRYAATEGKRPFGIGMLQRYTQRVCNLTATDPFATQSFYEVLNMLKPPAALFHPRILFPALFTHPRDAAVVTDENRAATAG